MGSYLDTMVPLIMNFVTSQDGDDELKESGLQTFEALVVRCFREVTPYISEVRGLILLAHELFMSSLLL